MDDESSIDVSTTGDDDPPDSVSKFRRRLNRKTNSGAKSFYEAGFTDDGVG